MAANIWNILSQDSPTGPIEKTDAVISMQDKCKGECRVTITAYGIYGAFLSGFGRGRLRYALICGPVKFVALKNMRE